MGTLNRLGTVAPVRGTNWMVVGGKAGPRSLFGRCRLDKVGMEPSMRDGCEVEFELRHLPTGRDNYSLLHTY